MCYVIILIEWMSRFLCTFPPAPFHLVSHCNEYWFQSVGPDRLDSLRPHGLQAACQEASLSFTISRSLLRLMSTESAMLSNHLILCLPFLLLPSIFPSIKVFSNESALQIRWPKYWSFCFSISPSRIVHIHFIPLFSGCISTLN